MPQLYQHEILFRAHDDMGHQDISKVVARIQERLEFSVQWANMLASVSLAKKFETSLEMYASTLKTIEVDTSMS